MLVERTKLAAHLSKISCGGLISSVFLTENLKAKGVSDPGDLCVVSDGVAWAEPLPEDVPVADLDLLVRTLAGKKETITFEFDPVQRYIILTTEHSVYRLKSSPDGVSRPDPPTLTDLQNLMPTKWTPLPRQLADGVVESSSLIKPDEILFTCGQHGTSIFGGDRSKSFQFSFPELVAPEEYDLTFAVETLIPVLRTIGEKAQVAFTGPSKPVFIREDSYLYFLRPVHRE